MTVVVSPTVRLVASADTETLKSDTSSVTVITTDPVCPPDVAVMVVVPAASAVTVPEAVTIATEVSLEAQVGLIIEVVPSLYVAVAVTVAVSPTVRLVASADTEILKSDTTSATVIATDPVCPPDVAMMVATPAALAVTVPVVLTLATDESLDPQAGLIVEVVPSL